jgi:hypothetical protein
VDTLLFLAQEKKQKKQALKKNFGNIVSLH